MIGEGRIFSTIKQKYKIDRILKEKDYVLLLPLKELLGNPNFVQNPDWE